MLDVDNFGGSACIQTYGVVMCVMTSFLWGIDWWCRQEYATFPSKIFKVRIIRPDLDSLLRIVQIWTGVSIDVNYFYSHYFTLTQIQLNNTSTAANLSTAYVTGCPTQPAKTPKSKKQHPCLHTGLRLEDLIIHTGPMHAFLVVHAFHEVCALAEQKQHQCQWYALSHCNLTLKQTERSS